MNRLLLEDLSAAPLLSAALSDSRKGLLAVAAGPQGAP